MEYNPDLPMPDCPSYVREVNKYEKALKGRDGHRLKLIDVHGYEYITSEWTFKNGTFVFPWKTTEGEPITKHLCVGLIEDIFDLDDSTGWSELS